MEGKDSLMSKLRHLRRTTPSPSTVSHNSDGFRDLPQRSASWKARDIDRQASEIERLVKLAEQCASNAERRQQPSAKWSTTARPMREHTDGGNSTQRQWPVKNRHSNVILLPVAKTAPGDVATASDSRRRHQGVQSPLTLSQLLNVESLERCPKCHKVRIDINPTCGTNARGAQSRDQGSGKYSSRTVRFKPLVNDTPTTTATTGHSRSRKTPVKVTEHFGVKTALPTSSTFTPARRSTISWFNPDVDQGQGQGRHIPACNTAAVLTNHDSQSDMNNNNDGESISTNVRSTWPRKAADDPSSMSPCDNRRRSSRLRLPVWRKRPSLSAVQQVWAEQSMQRTANGDSEKEQNANNSSPSAASSYDPLDTVIDTDGEPSVDTPVNGCSVTANYLANLTSVAERPVSDKYQQTTSSTVSLSTQHPTNTDKLHPDNVRITGRRSANKPSDHSSLVKPRHSDGVAAQLVISVPVINWASRTPNPRRRVICVAPSVTQHIQSSPNLSTAVSRDDHPRRSRTPWTDPVATDDHCTQLTDSYNYGRSWYDGLDQLD